MSAHCMDVATYANVQAFLRDVCARHASRTVLTADDGAWALRFGEMLDLWHAGGQFLRQRGVTPGEMVLLSLGNGLGYLLAWGSILMSGGVPVMVNPSASPEQLSDLAGRSGARFTVAGKGIPGVTVLWEGDFAPERLADLPVEALAATSGHADLAYVIFSSGTSGRMKGTKITHGNILSELETMIHAYQLRAEDSHLCVLPLYHASALLRNFLMPVALGARVVLEREFDASRFWRLVEEHQIAFVQVVPTILSLLLRHPAAPSEGTACPLRYIGSASSPCPSGLISKFEARFGVPVFEGYGMTETTCGVTLNPPETGMRRLGSVGLPLPGAHVEAVDEQGRVLPVGAEGELRISGPMVSPGYIDADEAARKKLSAGVILSNDMGFVDPDGYVFITGRKTDLIYRSGFKIAPKEVEEALSLHNSIESAVAFGVPHEYIGEDLIAYVLPKEGIVFSESVIRAFLKEQLIRYKVPTRIVAAAELFSTQTFKMRRADFRRHYLESRGRATETESVSGTLKLRAFLSGERVYLRPITDEDIASQRYLDNIMTADFQQFTLSGRFPQSQRAVREYWDSLQLPHSMALAICCARTDEHVGNFTLRVDWVCRHAEFGRMIFKEFQHEDYSTDAMRLIMKYVFEDLQLNRMWGGGGNPSSMPSLIRLGFRCEGRMRQHSLLGGKWRDLFMMGMLAEEYFAIKEGRPVAEQAAGLCSPEILQKLCEVVADAFSVDISEVSSSSSPSTIKEWDSLGTLLLWSYIEDVFEVRLSADDMIGSTSLGDIAIILEGLLHGR